MNTENEAANDESAPEIKTYSEEQFKSLETENLAMKSKMDELLGETKKAKSAKRESDEATRIANEEKAQKAGDFEQLYKSSEDVKNDLQNQLNDLHQGIANEKSNRKAMEIAASIADGVNAELLSDYVSKRLKHTDEGIKVLDANGQLTVSSIEDLTNEFKNAPRFAALLRGNQSSGGGAPGGNSSSATSKVIPRADFDKMEPNKRMGFIKSGGKITN